MRLKQVSTVISALAVATLFELVGVAKQADAASIQLFGLTDNNALVDFNSNNPNRSRMIGVTGITGTLLGIDFRPANGLLYGLTDTNNIYTIDTTTGAATLVSTLSIPFTGGLMSGVDFNPTPDRLRVVGSNEQNLRINVDNGVTLVDSPLAYAPGDANFGQDPNITAAAYTNSFAPSPDPTRRTTLYEIDSALDILVTQGSVNFLAGDPAPAVSPNTGQLFTVGSLGIDFGATGGLDIFSPRSGVNSAFAASGSTLYTIDLNTGSATTVGRIGNGNVNIVGLAAARSVPEPGTIGALIGLGAFTLLGWHRRPVKSEN